MITKFVPPEIEPENGSNETKTKLQLLHTTLGWPYGANNTPVFTQSNTIKNTWTMGCITKTTKTLNNYFKQKNTTEKLNNKFPGWEARPAVYKLDTSPLTQELGAFNFFLPGVNTPYCGLIRFRWPR